MNAVFTSMQLASPTSKLGRPLSEVATSILTAAKQHCTATQCPTLQELAQLACVSQQAVRVTVPNLVRQGHLLKVRERKVGGRNRPAHEYAAKDSPAAESVPWVDLGKTFAAWVS